MTQNIPSWMLEHIQGIHSTVSVAQAFQAKQKQVEDILSSRISHAEAVSLYATPLIMSLICTRLLSLLQGIIVNSRLKDGAAYGNKITDWIKQSIESTDKELRRLRGVEPDFADWIEQVCDQFITEQAASVMEQWRNAFSAMLLKRKVSNDNLRDFMAYAMESRAIAYEVKDCLDATQNALNTHLEGCTYKFHLYGNSLFCKMRVCTNKLCDQLGCPSYDDTMQDFNVKAGQDQWVRAIGALMVGIKNAKVRIKQ